MKTKKLLLIATFVMTLLSRLFALIPAVAATGSPYVDPDDTSINFDMLFIVGGLVWLGGILFYTIGRFVTNKYATKN